MINREVMPWEDVLAIARLANDHYSMTERQQELVYELALTIPEGGLIVELGVCHGKTAIVLALAAMERDGKYVGIDNWSLEGSREEVAALFDKIFAPKHESWSWRLFNDDTHAEHWKEDKYEVDLLLIDAGHDEENVREDCRIWIPKVKPGGLVIFDDWPSGPRWQESCHEAVRCNAEMWTAEWEWAASYGKVVARRRPM
jgi:predicted O-methyltransferase YrrM